jgi:hypothetical protein
VLSLDGQFTTLFTRFYLIRSKLPSVSTARPYKRLDRASPSFEGPRRSVEEICWRPAPTKRTSWG